MGRQLLKTDQKAARAYVIAALLQEMPQYQGVVCFSCGNAARALRDAGVAVLEVGPCGGLTPARWWAPQEIAATWPHLFDATSGHLPAWVMAAVGRSLRSTLGDLDPTTWYVVPSGSGETVCCLAMAYPGHLFVAAYDDRNPATAYSEYAPLNGLVESLVVGRTMRGAPWG